MKIIAISDMHMDYRNIVIPQADTLVVAGDIDLDDLYIIRYFNEWLGRVPCKNKIVVYGNHDRGPHLNRKLCKEMLTNAIVLENEGIEIDGIRFWGSPITPTFLDWYFMADRGESIKKYWDAIPKGTDVLITHGPPMGILDVNDRGFHCGCEELRKRVYDIRPKVHIFGHIHNDGGKQHEEFGVRFHNVSVMDESYDVVNNPQEINI